MKSIIEIAGLTLILGGTGAALLAGIHRSSATQHGTTAFVAGAAEGNSLGSDPNWRSGPSEQAGPVAPGARNAPAAQEIRGLLPAGAGLVAIVGLSDAALATELAESGRVLVHILANDRDQCRSLRRELWAAGVYGAASAEVLFDPARLPYCDRMVNLLLVDKRSAAGRELTEAELLRVLAPGGWAVVIDGAGIRRVQNKPNAAMAAWPHQNCSATNNPVSDDALVGPVTALRWIDGFARAGTSMGGVGGIPVVANGVIVQDDTRGYLRGEGPRPIRSLRLVCRDAHSGIVRWAVPVRAARLWLAIDSEYLISAYPLRDHQPSTIAYVHSLATGEVLRTVRSDLGRVEPGMVEGVCRDGVAYIAAAESPQRETAAAGRLLAYELSTGKIRWELKAEGFDSFFSPSLTPDGKRLIVVKAKGRRTPISARWPWVYIHSVTCLDPADGKTLWENEQLRGLVTLHMPVSDRYAVFASPWGIASHYEHVPREKHAELPRAHGVIDLASGRVLWRKTTEDDDRATYRQWTQVALIRGEEVFLCSSSNAPYVVAWDAATGKLTRRLTARTLNQRCVRPRACGDYLLLGFGTFFDLQTGLHTDQNVSRSACAVGATPAYGSIYNGANGCGCFAQVRGYGAYWRAAPPEVLPDAKRLETGPWPPEPLASAQLTAASEVSYVVAPDDRLRKQGQWRAVVDTGKPLLDSWVNHEDSPYPTTEPVKAGELELVAVVCQHRLEARRGNRLVWTLTTGSRISSPPLVHQQRVYVASHDGWVYCCQLQDGRLLWRALVAPNVRWIVAYGQIESAWPVRNVVLHEGLICAAAGRHPELDGGIHLAGLDPASGRTVWRRVVAYDSANQWIDPAERKRQLHLNWVTNGGLTVHEGRLALVGLDVLPRDKDNDPRLTPLSVEEMKPLEP